MNSQNPDLMMTALGVTLREQREALGLSQAAFAKATGVALTTLKEMERGAAGTAISTWMRVWAHMHVAATVVAATGQRALTARAAVLAAAAAMPVDQAVKLEPIRDREPGAESLFRAGASVIDV